MDQERDPASAMYTLPAQFVDLARERLRRPTDWLWLMRQLFRFFLTGALKINEGGPPNPAPQWLKDGSWNDLMDLEREGTQPDFRPGCMSSALPVRVLVALLRGCCAMALSVGLLL